MGCNEAKQNSDAESYPSCQRSPHRGYKEISWPIWVPPTPHVHQSVSHSGLIPAPCSQHLDKQHQILFMRTSPFLLAGNLLAAATFHPCGSLVTHMSPRGSNARAMHAYQEQFSRAAPGVHCNAFIGTKASQTGLAVVAKERSSRSPNTQGRRRPLSLLCTLISPWFSTGTKEPVQEPAGRRPPPPRAGQQR